MSHQNMEVYTDRERFLQARKDYEAVWGEKWNKQRIAAVEEVERWKVEEEQDEEQGYHEEELHKHNLKHVEKWAHGEGEPKKVIARSGAVYDSGKRIRAARKRKRNARLDEAWRVELEAWEEILMIYELDAPDKGLDDLSDATQMNLDLHRRWCMPTIQYPARRRAARCDYCKEDVKEGISID